MGAVEIFWCRRALQRELARECPTNTCGTLLAHLGATVHHHYHVPVSSTGAGVLLLDHAA
jgi:hypothetical protein